VATLHASIRSPTRAPSEWFQSLFSSRARTILSLSNSYENFRVEDRLAIGIVLVEKNSFSMWAPVRFSGFHFVFGFSLFGFRLFGLNAERTHQVRKADSTDH
jgi:hypothetical protein